MTIGAHFNSWHAGTGVSDNAAGVAVMMESMRLALWLSKLVRVKPQ